MDNEKVFVIGDIHGCLDMLKKLMDKIAWTPNKDGLVFLGDYIDRGGDPKGVVDYILKLKRSFSAIECLKGNHEAMFMDYLSGEDPELFLINSGRDTLQSYVCNRSQEQEYEFLVPPDHMAFFQSLKSYIELGDYYLVHAGFRPGVIVNEQLEEDLIWIREPFINSSFDFGKRVIFGHTPFYEPLVMDNKIGLDTGAVYGHKLTCLELPEKRFYSIEA